MKPKPPLNKPAARPQRTIKIPEIKSSSEPKTRQDAIKNDIAVLMKSIDTSLSTIEQLLKAFRLATPEIVQLLTKECTLIFECKVCKNLFRSLSNFMTHKRGYCLGKFEELFQNHEHCDHTWYAKCRKSKTLSSRSTTRKDILTLLESMKHMTKEHTASEDVILKDIPTTNEALFNLRYESQEPKEKEKVVVEPVDVDTTVNSEPVDSSKCNFCGKQFTSQKALNIHTKTDHGDFKMCFVCPCCKKYFANSWSVYRHMYKVHRKTSDQVRKLRTQIQKKQVKLEELSRSKKSIMASPADEKVDQEKAYMEELRGHASLQRCSGCGKKFERKVALLSHAMHCQKKKKLPPELVHTLKRKSFTPMKMIEEKRLKICNKEMDETNIRMNPCVVLKKEDIPINFPSQQPSSSNQSSKDDGSLSPSEEEVNDLVQRYKGECVLGESTFEDILNKLHMEVPLEDNIANSDSEYYDSDYESRKVNNAHKNSVEDNPQETMNGHEPAQSESDSDESGSDDSPISISSSNDGNEVYIRFDTTKIKIENTLDEESIGEYGENNDYDDFDEETNFSLEAKSTEDLRKSIENSTTEDQQEDSVNEGSSINSVSNSDDSIEEILDNNDDSNSSESDETEGEERAEGEEEETEDEEEEDLLVEEMEGEAENEEEMEEEAENEEEMEEEAENEEEMEGEAENEEDIDEGELEDKDGNDSQIESRIEKVENSNMNDLDSKDSCLIFISGQENCKEGDSGEDYLSLVNDKDPLGDNLSSDSNCDLNIKDGLFESNNSKKECTLGVVDSENLMMDDTMDNYDVAKEIVLFNDCEEVCISTLSDNEHLEDSLPSNQISSGKNSPLVNGDSPSSPQNYDQDEEVDLISDRGDWVTKKINSYVNCPKKKCMLCLKTFHRVNFVRRHVALHFNINKFKCLVNCCNFQSFLRSDMNNHLMRVHKKKELDIFVGRLFPKKEDFDECEYNPDPKPPYNFEKQYRTNSEDIRKKSEITLMESSDKEESLSSPMIIDGSDLDIIEETEVATIENVIPHSSILQCNEAVDIVTESSIEVTADTDLRDIDLKNLPTSSSTDEKLKALTMEVIFGSETAESLCSSNPVS